jgi:large subunit ribosomal protein L7/L12
LAVAISREQVIEYLSALSPSALHDLMLELEDLWGIERPGIGPQYVTLGAPLWPPDSEWEPEFSVILREVGPHRVAVIRTVRAGLNVSISEARALVDSAPVTLREHLNHYEVEQLHNALRAVGAEVDVR